MEQVAPLYDRILESIRATPGVVSAAALSHPLIGGGHNATALSSPTLESGHPLTIWMNNVSPEFFDTMGMPIVEGRPLAAQDTSSSAKVAVMNQAAASRWIASLLFGVQRVDPVSISLVLLLLAAVASVAAFIPAWRAASVDPMVALRAE